jgi:hypothetical protein
MPFLDLRQITYVIAKVAAANKSAMALIKAVKQEILIGFYMVPYIE